MQPKLADCFVVPKRMTVFFEYFGFQKVFFFFFFYHAVFIMRIDCDCMFEEMMLFHAGFDAIVFDKFHFLFCSFPVLSFCQ